MPPPRIGVEGVTCPRFGPGDDAVIYPSSLAASERIRVLRKSYERHPHVPLGPAQYGKRMSRTVIRLLLRAQYRDRRQNEALTDQPPAGEPGNLTAIQDGPRDQQPGGKG